MSTQAIKTSRNGIRTIVLKNGQKSYEARINRRGLPAQSKSFPTRSEAVAWKNKIESAIDQGDRVSKNRKHLISDIIDSYLLHRSAELHAPNPIPKNKTYDYQRVKMDLGDMYIDKLTNEDIENYVRLLLSEPTLQSGKFKDKSRPPQKYAPATVRKFYYALKKAVTWHAKRHKYHLDADLFEMDDQVIPSAWAGVITRGAHFMAFR